MRSPKTDSCDYCRNRTYTDIPFTAVTHEGKIIHVVFRYCPVCGAEMKDVNP
jgi:hypothetical protein